MPAALAALAASASATRIEHPGEADRREQERQLEGRAEDGRAQVAFRNRHALARPESHLLKRAIVVAQRDLVFGAAVDVVEDDRRQTPLGEPAEIGDVDGSADGGRDTVRNGHSVALRISRSGANQTFMMNGS